MYISTFQRFNNNTQKFCIPEIEGKLLSNRKRLRRKLKNKFFSH